MNNFKAYLNVFWQLLKTDLLLFKQSVVSEIINVIILTGAFLLIVTYVYPLLGMSHEFGLLIAIGLFVNICYFKVYGTASSFIGDLEGNKTISYYKILPIPFGLIFIAKACSIACKTLILSLFVFPISKLVLLNKMIMPNFEPFKFVLILISINLFGGFLGIFMSSFVKKMDQVDTIWTRFIFPFWFFGAAEFPWKELFNLSSRIGYLALLNPLLYPMEGIRAASLGQSNFLSYWFCLAMIWVFGIAFIWLGIIRLRKRLDCV